MIATLVTIADRVMHWLFATWIIACVATVALWGFLWVRDVITCWHGFAPKQSAPIAPLSLLPERAHGAVPVRARADEQAP